MVAGEIEAMLRLRLRQRGWGLWAVVAGPAAVVNAGIVIFLQHLIYSHTVGKQISLENKNEQVPIYQLAQN
jgi:hypothetical protein